MIKCFNLCFLLLVFFTSCTDSHRDVDLSKVKKTAHFMRFDQAFFQTDTTNFKVKIDSLAGEYPEFFTRGKNLKFWKSQRLDDKQQALYQKVQEVFDKPEALNKNLNFSMKHFYYYFPKHPQVKFYAYISNLDFNYPVIFADTVCFAALDLYLGPKSPFYDPLPEYIAYFRQPAFLVRDCIEGAINSEVIHKTDASTLLDEMVYYGRKLYLLKQMMPQKSESIITQYPPEKLDFCKKNERSIWAYFVEQKELFSTSEDLKKRFIDLAPFSKFRLKFDNKTPGMIGRWVGLQIVEHYMKNHPEITIPQLAKETDARKILKLSGYKP